MSWNQYQEKLIDEHVSAFYPFSYNVQADLRSIMKSLRFYSLDHKNIIQTIFYINPINDEKERIIRGLEKDDTYIVIETTLGSRYFIFRTQEDLNFAKLLLNDSMLGFSLIPLLPFKDLIKKLKKHVQ